MFTRTKIALLGAVAGLGIMGCQSGTVEPTQPDTKLAAYAAATTFPSDMNPEMSRNVGAVIDATGHTIQIINFGKSTINNADVWVNGAYVYHVDTIAPYGSIKLDLANFYDKAGDSMTKQQVRVDTVQLKTDHGIYTLLGPVNQ